MTARPTNFRPSASPKSNARLRAEFEALKEQLAEKIRDQDVTIAEMSGSAASVHSNAAAVATVNRKAAPASFAANLIAALRAAGISQSDLAKRVGCSRSAVSDYVCGGKLPRKGMLERINEALGTNLSPTRPVNVKDFARDVGRGVETIRRGAKQGAFSGLCAAIVSKNGKRHSFVVFPEKYKELVNANA